MPTIRENITALIAAYINKTGGKNSILVDEVKEIFDEINDNAIFPDELPEHNSFGGLNVGDYQHLTAAGKTSVLAAKPTTIGTGGEYALITDAITAGKKNMLLVSNIAEVAHIVGLNMNINLNNYTLSMTTLNIRLSYSKLYNGTVNHGNSTNNRCIEANTNIADFSLFEDLTINNQATTSLITSCAVNSTGFYFLFNRVTFNLPNQDQCFATNSNNLKTYFNFQNCKIVLPGTSCSPRINGNFWNVEITGTAGAIAILGARIIGGYISLSNTRIDLAQSSNVIIVSSGINQINLTADGNDGNYNDIRISGTASTIAIRGRITTSEFSCNAAYTIGINAGTITIATKISNTKFLHTSGAVTINQHSELVNTSFAVGIAIAQSFCNLMGVLIGGVNAGTKTITVNAAVDKTILAFNRTEAAIVDSGTNTVLTSNLLY